MRKYISFLLLFFIAHSLFAQNVLTPEDVARIEFISNAIISEDGERIAYQLLVPRDPTKENAPAQNHLYVYNRETGTSTALVTNLSTGNIKFRPESNSITFTARQEGEKFTAIYEIPATGGEPQKLY